jgi:hypothetical protein
VTSTKPKKSWRDVLPVHPAADMFPMMSTDELRGLGEDIKATGLKSPIAITAKNVRGRWEYALLDGRNRLDAMELVDIKFALVLKKGHCCFEIKSILPYDCLDFFPDALVINGDAAYAYVVSANIHRRHLTAEQRQERLVQLIAAAPQKSNRQIGKETGVDHKTIARARAKGEDVGRIPHVETRTDSKGRAQPAHKTTTTTPDGSDTVSSDGTDKTVSTSAKADMIEVPGIRHPDAFFCPFDVSDSEFVEFLRYSKSATDAEDVYKNLLALALSERSRLMDENAKLKAQVTNLQAKIAAMETAAADVSDRRTTDDLLNDTGANGVPKFLDRQEQS